MKIPTHNPNRTILVVDDKLAGREFASAVLGSLNVEVITVGDGLEALEVILERRPFLVLLDLCMPVLDGFALVRELPRNPETATILVVALTASAMEGDRERALGSGFDGFITKPVGSADLRAQVTAYLRLQEFDQPEEADDDYTGSTSGLTAVGEPGFVAV